MPFQNRPCLDSRADTSQPDGVQRRFLHPQKNSMSNFSYPRTKPVHSHQQDRPGDRASVGSDCSAPAMVEDHGSDFSTEDDCQDDRTGTDLWESFWRVQESCAKGADNQAAIDTTVESGHDSDTAMVQEALLTTRDRTPGTETQGCSLSQPVNQLRPRQQRPRTPKSKPRASYSLFPSSSTDKRRPTPLRLSPGVQQRASGPSQSSARNVSKDAKGDLACGDAMLAFKPTSPTVAARSSSPEIFVAAGSFDPVPVLPRTPPISPQPSPPVSIRDKSSPSEATSPQRLRTGLRSPSLNNLRHRYLSRVPTRSSPALARLAKRESQSKLSVGEPQVQTRITPDLYARPLPPLPAAERPPSPPHISVFETDSDDEEDGSDTKRFARRLMQGLVHHHHHDVDRDHRRRNKSPFSDHKRSVSDEGPVSSKERGGSGSRMGLNRAVHAARHRRSGIVSMDLPREEAQQYHFEPELPEGRSRGWSRIFSRRRG